LQLEQQFTQLRTRAIAQVGSAAHPDTGLANRIEREVLPRFAAELEPTQPDAEADVPPDLAAPRWTEYLKLRQESWQLLADALRENDPEKLRRHVELWDRCENLIVGVRAETQSLAKRTDAQRVEEFQRALVTFTPRTIAMPAIVVANLLVFAAMVLSGVHLLEPNIQDVLDWGANFGPKTINGQWWRLVTSMFLHFGILHLGFNMWILWDLGGLVERLVGNVGFVVLYFVSGIAGSIASLAWYPAVISAGASGAVFGVAGALLGLLALRRDTVPVEVLRQLRNSMLGFLLYNVLYGMSSEGIDMAAHFGGLAAGFACGLVLSQPLSVEMIGRRGVRNGVLAVGSAIALPLAALALPAAPPDIDQVMLDFATVEEEALDLSSTLADRAQRGEISDADYAKTIQRDVLPSWIEARQRMEGLLAAPHVDQTYFSRLIEYMQAREECWQLRIEGLQEQDPTKMELANDRSLAADAIAEELSTP
jgi:rhomboid protease GluP